MSNPQTQAAPKNVEAPPSGPRIMSVDFRSVVTLGGATTQRFETSQSAMGDAKPSMGFTIALCRLGVDGLPVALKAGEAWDGVKLSKVLTDRIRNVRVTHSAFVPRENVAAIMYSPE